MNKQSTLTRLQSPHRAAILELHEKAQTAAQEAKASTAAAVQAAHRCGQLLLAEKEWFNRTLGRKHLGLDGEITGGQRWIAYVATFAPALAEDVGARYVKLATRHMTQGEFEFDLQGGSNNVIRAGMLALDLFPAKAHQPIEEDRKMPSVGSHLAAVNKLARWWRDFRTKTEPTPIPDKVRTQLLADFAPLIAMLDELRSPRANRQPTPGKKTTT